MHTRRPIRGQINFAQGHAAFTTPLCADGARELGRSCMYLVQCILPALLQHPHMLLLSQLTARRTGGTQHAAVGETEPGAACRTSLQDELLPLLTSGAPAGMAPPPAAAQGSRPAAAAAGSSCACLQAAAGLLCCHLAELPSQGPAGQQPLLLTAARQADCVCCCLLLLQRGMLRDLM